jgi:hypothetical protein
MECPVPVRAGALLIAAAASVFCADATRWGSVVDGLQLGIGATSTPEPALHVLLKNAGPRVQEVPTGFEGEPDPPFNVTITARAPREGDLQVFDLNAARYWPPDIGPGPARSFRLEPGGVHEFTYPLSQLICVVNRTDTPLSKLLKQGYTVRASFEFRGTAVMSRPLSAPRPAAGHTATP